MAGHRSRSSSRASNASDASAAKQSHFRTSDYVFFALLILFLLLLLATVLCVHFDVFTIHGFEEGSVTLYCGIAGGIAAGIGTAKFAWNMWISDIVDEKMQAKYGAAAEARATAAEEAQAAAEQREREALGREQAANTERDSMKSERDTANRRADHVELETLVSEYEKVVREGEKLKATVLAYRDLCVKLKSKAKAAYERYTVALGCSGASEIYPQIIRALEKRSEVSSLDVELSGHCMRYQPRVRTEVVQKKLELQSDLAKVSEQTAKVALVQQKLASRRESNLELQTSLQQAQAGFQAAVDYIARCDAFAMLAATNKPKMREELAKQTVKPFDFSGIDHFLVGSRHLAAAINTPARPGARAALNVSGHRPLDRSLLGKDEEPETPKTSRGSTPRTARAVDDAVLPSPSNMPARQRRNWHAGVYGGVLDFNQVDDDPLVNPGSGSGRRSASPTRH